MNHLPLLLVSVEAEVPEALAKALDVLLELQLLPYADAMA